MGQLFKENSTISVYGILRQNLYCYILYVTLRPTTHYQLVIYIKSHVNRKRKRKLKKGDAFFIENLSNIPKL